jgi:hypothetical protein
MKIPEKQILSKKRVGTLHGHAIVELRTVGGLCLWAKAEPGKDTEILAAGPHPGLCRYLAEQKNPDIMVSELSKGDHIDIRSLQSLEAKYTQVTEQLNALLKKV